MSSVSLENINFKAGEKTILGAVSTKFKANSLTCILGPNGAGKTTLIKCIAKLLKVSGKVEINSKELSELSPDELARMVSYVPQSISSEINFSVEEFVMFSRYPWQGVSELKREKQDEIFHLTGLEEFKSQSMKTLSGGERQRALIAAALIQETDIILLDEITSALDPKYQDQVIQILLKVRDSGKTLIWATHDINAALLYADSLLALKEGKVFGEASPKEFLEKDILEQLYERKFQKMLHSKYDKTVLI